MRRISTAAIVAVAVLCLSFATAHAQDAYKVLSITKVGGDGGFDYVYADSPDRKLFIPRMGQSGRVTVFNLDSLAPLGDIPNTSGHGVAVDHASHHGFVSSNPVTMFDANSLAVIKTITTSGSPDGILADQSSGRIFVFSHRAPNVTVINAADGSILGTIDLGGAPEQAQSDGRGHLYIDLEDKGSIAVVDTASLKLTRTISLNGKGDGCAGLALDAKNGILFAACRAPQLMVILSTSGNILTTLPIGRSCDGAAFNPATGEAFSTQGDGTLTIIKETSPTTFAVAQTVTTPSGARTISLDSTTGRIFTVTGQYGPPPPAAPGTAPGTASGQRRSRPAMLPGSFSIITVGK